MTKKSGVIYAGALYPGAERRFVVYVEKVREDEYGRMPKMLAVTATCWQHGHEKDKSDEQKMVIVTLLQIQSSVPATSLPKLVQPAVMTLHCRF
jgi:hypothetical protein